MSRRARGFWCRLAAPKGVAGSEYVVEFGPGQALLADADHHGVVGQAVLVAEVLDPVSFGQLLEERLPLGLILPVDNPGHDLPLDLLEGQDPGVLAVEDTDDVTLNRFESPPEESLRGP